MAFFSLHAYDADVFIPEFRGLDQSDTSLKPDMRFAAEAENVETPNGVLQPQAANTILSGEFDHRIETLLRFHRRYYSGTGSKDFLVAAVDGKLYQRQEGAGSWEPITLPDGVQAFESNVWSWVTYEINIAGTDFPVDVLLISNAYDGMYIIIPSDVYRTWGLMKIMTWQQIKNHSWGWARTPEWIVLPVDTKGNKFGTIERHDERIWGGGIIGEEDRLVYSAPYNPMDWEQNEEIPEDGAGEILLPSWDGDMFTTLKSFGDQLIAFKRNRVWRIIGTNPGEYTINEQYGGGAPFPNTVLCNIERMIFAGRDGMSTYDGMSVSGFARDQIIEFWKTLNRSAMDQMCAEIYKEKYYLAVPTGDSAVNNALVIIDLKGGQILTYTGIYIESLLATEDRLYATSSSLPGKVMEMHYDSWEEGLASGKAAKWVSNWMDFGRKDIQKGGFDLYMLPEVQDTAVKLIISIQTEKKVKTKEYTIQPLTAEAKAAQKQFRDKKLHFGGSGRRFRLIIQTEESTTAPWRLLGGLHVIAETDPD